MTDDSEFVFAALGGLGEIGMNCALYGYGPAKARKWLMVDLGVAFAGEELPGVDLIMPDVGFIEKVKKDLVGIIITHAHEDHIGALAELWPSLGAQVYASRFAAGLAEARRLGEPGAPEDSDRDRQAGRADRDRPVRRRIRRRRPFDSGKLGARDPHAGRPRRPQRRLEDRPDAGRSARRPTRRASGRSATRACWRSSATRPTCCARARARRSATSPRRSPSWSPGRRAGWSSPHSPPTSRGFAPPRRRASPPGGRSACSAARWSGSSRSRANAACSNGVPPFLGMDAFERLPRDKVLALATGSQGEPRAALARMAEDEHPIAELSPGDTVIFSSRTIPGNEKAVGKLINAFVRRASRSSPTATRSCMSPAIRAGRSWRKMYAWLRPKIAVPAHGEAVHLTEHAAFAKAQGVPQVLRAFNGDLVRFAPGDAATIGKLGRGKRLKDGEILLPAEQECVAQRRRLSFAGVVSIALALTPKGEMAGDPGRDDRRPARAHARRRRRSTRSSTRRFSRPSRACRAASGATPTSCRPRSSAPCATRSTPSGARSRRCMRWWSRCRGGEQRVKARTPAVVAWRSRSNHPPPRLRTDCSLRSHGKALLYEASLSFRDDRDSFGRRVI